jgi:hypothetical protein
MVKVSREKIKLISGFMSRLPALALTNEYTEKKVRTLLKRQSGVYALYEDNNIYYIGKADNLHKRLKDHLADNHKGKWNSFSFAELEKPEHKEELEDLLISIIHPPGNAKEEKKVKRDIEVENQIKSILELVKPDDPRFHKQKYNATNRIRGKHFTHKKAETLILRILSHSRQPLTRKQIVKAVQDKIQNQLRPVDKQHLTNGRPRWENIVRWEVTGMNMRKFITSTRNNDWVLTKAGKRVMIRSGTK